MIRARIKFITKIGQTKYINYYIVKPFNRTEDQIKRLQLNCNCLVFTHTHEKKNWRQRRKMKKNEKRKTKKTPKNIATISRIRRKNYHDRPELQRQLNLIICIK